MSCRAMCTQACGGRDLGRRGLGLGQRGGKRGTAHAQVLEARHECLNCPKVRRRCALKSESSAQVPSIRQRPFVSKHCFDMVR